MDVFAGYLPRKYTQSLVFRFGALEDLGRQKGPIRRGILKGGLFLQCPLIGLKLFLAYK